LEHAAQDFHEGALAGAVGADQCVDFARAAGQACRLQRVHPAEALRDAVCLEQDCRALTVRTHARSSPETMPAPGRHGNSVYEMREVSDFLAEHLLDVEIEIARRDVDRREEAVWLIGEIV